MIELSNMFSYNNLNKRTDVDAPNSENKQVIVNFSTEHADATTVLSVQNISYAYTGEKSVFSDISFKLHKGEVLCILGANGIGKSTLLNCICGHNTISQGRIELDGKNIASMSVKERALHIAYVPQITHFACAYSVRDCVVMGRAPYMSTLAQPKAEQYRIVDEILERMSLRHLAHKTYNALSGGEQQQVQIARALAQDTKILVLDEPTNHLDFRNQIKILDMINELRKQGYCILLTTHNPDHALLLDDQVFVMLEDHKSLHAPARDVITQSLLQKLYHTQAYVVFSQEAQRCACISGAL